MLFESGYDVRDLVKENGRAKEELFIELDSLFSVLNHLDFSINDTGDIVAKHDSEMNAIRKIGIFAPVNGSWGDRLLLFQPKMSTSNQVSKVIVRGWDPATKTQVTKASVNSVSNSSADIEVLFNPKEYVIEKSAPWQEHHNAGLDIPQLEFTSGESMVLDVELFFDTYENGKNVKDHTMKIHKLAHIDGGPERPPTVSFEWGQSMNFTFYLTKLDVTYTKFNPDGIPIRAKVGVTLNEGVSLEEQIEEKFDDSRTDEPSETNSEVKANSHVKSDVQLSRSDEWIRPEFGAFTFEVLSVFTPHDENETRMDYVVQYRETQYNFICRLLEQEGIFYFTVESARDVFFERSRSDDDDDDGDVGLPDTSRVHVWMETRTLGDYYDVSIDTTASDDEASIRFGDGISGRRPPTSSGQVPKTGGFRIGQGGVYIPAIESDPGFGIVKSGFTAGFDADSFFDFIYGTNLKVRDDMGEDGDASFKFDSFFDIDYRSRRAPRPDRDLLIKGPENDPEERNETKELIEDLLAELPDRVFVFDYDYISSDEPKKPIFGLKDSSSIWVDNSCAGEFGIQFKDDLNNMIIESNFLMDHKIFGPIKTETIVNHSNKITIPKISSGGSDPEDPDAVRTTATQSVRSMSRAISPDDFADITFGGNFGLGLRTANTLGPGDFNIDSFFDVKIVVIDDLGRKGDADYSFDSFFDFSIEGSFVDEGNPPVEFVDTNYSFDAKIDLKLFGEEHIESLSSKLWTDYNIHDPGITILEILCYALTDIGFRSGTSIRGNLTPDAGFFIRQETKEGGGGPKITGDSFFDYSHKILDKAGGSEEEYRVKVKFPWLPKDEDEESFWSAFGIIGGEREFGSFFLPEVDDEVLVDFIEGDIRFPVVIGGVWNGKDEPPELKDDIEVEVEHSIISRDIIKTYFVLDDTNFTLTRNIHPFEIPDLEEYYLFLDIQELEAGILPFYDIRVDYISSGGSIYIGEIEEVVDVINEDDSAQTSLLFTISTFEIFFDPNTGSEEQRLVSIDEILVDIFETDEDTAKKGKDKDKKKTTVTVKVNRIEMA
jgi:hypothetical protein